jgi:hypothetical protein
MEREAVPAWKYVLGSLSGRSMIFGMAAARGRAKEAVSEVTSRLLADRATRLCICN